MATFPLAHTSSPAVVKATSTSRTIATAAFDPPARVAIVAGVTSDADNATGAAPTIAAIPGLTWTRVGPALGFSATGDVGLVALWQGVLDNPDTDLGSITVTVDTNITASKPKMLVVRVYDETQVDISDPIGAIASGSFATSTNFLGIVTPETTNGGLRGLWLDWAATGVPTTFLPNNDNAELVDSFHNAGLSTNGQISRRNPTRAGVQQSLGANLLATSSDGNWLVYELRGPVLTGSAFDSGAFDTAAFDTGSAAIPSVSGSGSWSFAGAGSGKRDARATGVGSWSFVGSGSSKRTPKASGSGTFTFTGAGVGAAPTPPPGQASGSGSWGFAGAGTGKRVAKASGSGTVTFAGTGIGRRIAKATGGGTLAWTAAGTGKRTPKAGGAGGWTFAGTGTGRRSPKAAGSGSWTFVGAGIGNSPGVGMSEAFGIGSWGFTGSGVGKRSPKAGGTGTLLWAGVGTSKRRPIATGAGSWSLAAAAVGRRQPVAIGSGALAWVGVGVGAQPGPPTEFTGRILSATLAIPAATGSIAIPAATGDLVSHRASGRLSILRAKGVIA